MADSPLYLRRLLLGQMENYVYLVGCRTTHECWVVDPAWDIDTILRTAAADDMEITGALVTHYHQDHVGGDIFGMHIPGCAALLEKISVPLHVQSKELSGVAEVTGVSAKDLVGHAGGDELKIGDLTVKLLHTPGHTPGSQCFLVEGNLISGDTLFYGSCGRVDLPGGNPEELYRSLHDVLKKLPPETILYPGHRYGPVETSTLGDECQTNPYLQVPSLEQWLAMMGHGG